MTLTNTFSSTSSDREVVYPTIAATLPSRHPFHPSTTFPGLSRPTGRESRRYSRLLEDGATVTGDAVACLSLASSLAPTPCSAELEHGAYGTGLSTQTTVNYVHYYSAAAHVLLIATAHSNGVCWQTPSKCVFVDLVSWDCNPVDADGEDCPPLPACRSIHDVPLSPPQIMLLSTCSPRGPASTYRCTAGFTIASPEACDWHKGDGHAQSW
jgi:hypothetical protein